MWISCKRLAVQAQHPEQDRHARLAVFSRLRRSIMRTTRKENTYKIVKRNITSTFEV